MTLPPTHDDRLVDFLRRHQVAPPPASPELEAQIMAAIATPPSAISVQRRQWAVSVLAASLLLLTSSWGIGRWFGPRWQTAAIDDFLTDTWYASVYDDEARLPLDTTQPDWLVSVYATPY